MDGRQVRKEVLTLAPTLLARFFNYGQPFGANCSATLVLHKGHHQKWHRLIECTKFQVSNENQTLTTNVHIPMHAVSSCVSQAYP